MNRSAAIAELVEAIKTAIEEALDEGQPRIATELLTILNSLEAGGGAPRGTRLC